MMLPKDISLVENILLDVASEQETNLFNIRMIESTAFKAYYEEQKMIHEVIILNELYALDKEVRAFKPRSNNNLRNGLLGVGCLLLLGITAFFLFEKDEKTSQNRENITSELQRNTIQVDSSITENLINEEPISEDIKTKKQKNTPSREKISVLTNEKIAIATSPGTNPDSVAIVSNKLPITNSETNNTITTKEKELLPHCEPFNVLLQLNQPCTHNFDGEILIKQLSGGVKPYSVKLNNKVLNDELHGKNLSSGNYYLHITDVNQCDTLIEVELIEKRCNRNNQIAYNPTSGPLALPLENELEGEIILRDLNGNIVKRLYKVRGQEVFWDGTDIQDNLLLSGVYALTFTDTDGPQIVYITLIR